MGSVANAVDMAIMSIDTVPSETVAATETGATAESEESSAPETAATTETTATSPSGSASFAYACIPEQVWDAMEWNLPVVITSDPKLFFFKEAAAAIDYAVRDLAMEGHITFQRTMKPKKKPLPRPAAAAAASDHAAVASDHVLRSPGVAMSPGQADEPYESFESYESLVKLVMHRWYLVKVPYAKEHFLPSKELDRLRVPPIGTCGSVSNYITLDARSEYAPVSVPGPYHFQWAPIASVAEKALQDRRRRQEASRRRRIEETEDGI